jgi:hypothetical protein
MELEELVKSSEDDPNALSKISVGLKSEYSMTRSIYLLSDPAPFVMAVNVQS